MGCCISSRKTRDHDCDKGESLHRDGGRSTAAKTNSRSQKTSKSKVNPTAEDAEYGYADDSHPSATKPSEELSLPRLTSAEEEDPENWQPFRNPSGMMAEATRQLANYDWEGKRDALNAVRRLAFNHDEVLCSQLHLVTVAVVAEVRNLRSQVSRLAMVCLGDMYTKLKTNMDTDLELTVGVLLGKMGESNKFIREDADKSLKAMVYNVSPAKAIAALIACGDGHRNVMVRNATARHLASVVELIGPSRVLREFPDKVLPVVARFLLDGSPEARYSGSCIIYSLMTSNPDECDHAISRHVLPKDQRNIKDKLSQLKQKGLGPPPASMSRNHARQTKPNARNSSAGT